MQWQVQIELNQIIYYASVVTKTQIICHVTKVTEKNMLYEKRNKKMK
jgi:hypothetical protein